MSKFILRVREVHYQGYAVEADSAEDAVRGFWEEENEGEIVGSLEYGAIEGIAAVEDEDGNLLLDAVDVEKILDAEVEK